MAATATLMSDFLKELGVRHTAAYTDWRFSGMPFKSLFGLSKLLLEYGVDNEALRLAEKSEIGRLPVPFLAGTDGGFVIVRLLFLRCVLALGGHKLQFLLDIPRV